MIVKGSKVVVEGLEGDEKVLNGMEAEVLNIATLHDIEKAKIIFKEPAYLYKPIKAQVLIYSIELKYLKELCKKPKGENNEK